MTKSMPHVQKYMSTDIQTIGDEQTMLMAHRLMRQAKVHHLPVLRQGQLVGILSDRDLNLLESLSTVDPKVVTVSDAMNAAPYVVAPTTSLAEVVGAMTQQKHGAAVVCDHHKVVGIFTAADALVALATLLSARSAA